MHKTFTLKFIVSCVNAWLIYPYSWNAKSMCSRSTCITAINIFFLLLSLDLQKEFFLIQLFTTAFTGWEQSSKMNGHLNFEEGWKVLEQGIVKCSKILECTSTRPTVAEYMNYYEYASITSWCSAYLIDVFLKVAVHHFVFYFLSCSYRMAVQKQDYCREMYNGFKTTLSDCVRAMVQYLFLL